MRLWVVAVAVSSVLTLSSGAKAAAAEPDHPSGVICIINKVLPPE